MFLHIRLLYFLKKLTFAALSVEVSMCGIKYIGLMLFKEICDCSLF